MQKIDPNVRCIYQNLEGAQSAKERIPQKAKHFGKKRNHLSALNTLGSQISGGGQFFKQNFSTEFFSDFFAKK
jgi:hypothetical protein